MKQIYDFEKHNPPVLNESLLRNKMEQRKLRLQTALIAFASMLVQAVLVMLGFFTFEEYPFLSAICIVYVILSTTGGGVLAIVYTRKGGLTI